jgi:exodeoxyribonuclease III
VDTYGSVEAFLKRMAMEYSGEGDGDFLLCLQEVKITEEKLSKESCCMDEPLFESYWACSKKKKGYSGVSCLTTSKAHSVCIDELSKDVDGEGRFVSVDLGVCVVVNVYVPNAGLGKRSGSNVGDGGSVADDDNPRVEYKMRFMKELLRYCSNLIVEEKRDVVIVGDFNSCFSKRDVHWSIGIDQAFLQCELDALEKFTHDGLFTDIYRRRNPTTDTSFTCFDERTNARERNVGVRIDFVLVSQNLVDKVKACDIVSHTIIHPKWSDHCALYVDIDISSFAPEGDEPPSRTKEWTQLRRRLLNTSQKSILSMFGKRSLTVESGQNEKKTKN